jgi:glutathione S-transferase
VLIDDGLHIWDSLAIVEYLNERVQGRAWPAASAVRAHARSVSAEMHSGFTALRQTWSMRAVGTNLNVPLTPAAADDVARIDELWNECRRQYAAQGPWLFGEYCIADAMYAPVVLRFNHYGATLSATGAAYMRQTLQDPHLQQWIADAAEEAAGR